MGCCFSRDDDKVSQHGEPNEATTLLGNPVRNGTSRPSYSDDIGTQISSPYGHKGDEQSALNKILHVTATNIIDVAAIDSHLEQNECLERSRHYEQRVNATTNQRSSLVIRQPNLLSDVSAPDKVLAAPLSTHQEIQWMQLWTEKVYHALTNVKVTQKEDLVVQFGIP